MAFCIFIFFHFPDSGLSVLNGLHFYFWSRDSENGEFARRSHSNFRKSNPIELQSFDWFRLGSAIELNRTHPKLLLIEHNRTLKQSNIKPVSSGFKQKALSSNKLCIGFNFKHEYAKMSQRADRKTQTVLETIMVKGYHECPLSPSVSVITSLLRRKGEI